MVDGFVVTVYYKSIVEPLVGSYSNYRVDNAISVLISSKSQARRIFGISALARRHVWISGEVGSFPDVVPSENRTAWLFG